MPPVAATPPSPPRLLSLDQFRGFTVASMFLVNFIGGYDAAHPILGHHNTWCSFADTVMPGFFFAAGMALRLVILRETEKHGRAAALRRGVKRGLLLMALGFLWYGTRGIGPWAEADGWSFVRAFLTSPFEALTSIGLTSLWVLPVIGGSARARVFWMLGSAAAHLGLSGWFWYSMLHEWRVTDGGPLGFLTWTTPLLAGSLAFDAVRAPGSFRRLLGGGAVMMAAGYALACLTAGGAVAAPPFVPPWHPADMWTMSQRAGSASYLTFSAGFSLVVYAFFHWWSDGRGKSLTLFTDLGRNALAGYLLHEMVGHIVDPLGPRDSPLWWAVALSAAGMALSWRLVRLLNARGLYLRL